MGSLPLERDSLLVPEGHLTADGAILGDRPAPVKAGPAAGRQAAKKALAGLSYFASALERAGI
jgi:hypothetical protein